MQQEVGGIITKHGTKLSVLAMRKGLNDCAAKLKVLVFHFARTDGILMRRDGILKVQQRIIVRAFQAFLTVAEDVQELRILTEQGARNTVLVTISMLVPFKWGAITTTLISPIHGGLPVVSGVKQLARVYQTLKSLHPLIIAD